MAAGDAEYRALTAAFETTDPSCLDDSRFVLEPDELDPEDVAGMKRICRGCALVDLCSTFAAKARPPAGMWAGNHYKPSQRRTRKDAA